MELLWVKVICWLGGGGTAEDPHMSLQGRPWWIFVDAVFFTVTLVTLHVILGFSGWGWTASFEHVILARLDVQKCLLVFDCQVFMFAGIWALDRPRLNLSFLKQHETCRQEVRCRMLIFVVDSIKELLSLFQISENADPTFCWMKTFDEINPFARPQGVHLNDIA